MSFNASLIKEAADIIQKMIDRVSEHARNYIAELPGENGLSGEFWDGLRVDAATEQSLSDTPLARRLINSNLPPFHPRSEVDGPLTNHIQFLLRTGLASRGLPQGLPTPHNLRDVFVNFGSAQEHKNYIANQDRNLQVLSKRVVAGGELTNILFMPSKLGNDFKKAFVDLGVSDSERVVHYVLRNRDFFIDKLQHIVESHDHNERVRGVANSLSDADNPFTALPKLCKNADVTEKNVMSFIYENPELFSSKSVKMLLDLREGVKEALVSSWVEKQNDISLYLSSYVEKKYGIDVLPGRVNAVFRMGLNNEAADAISQFLKEKRNGLNPRIEAIPLEPKSIVVANDISAGVSAIFAESMKPPRKQEREKGGSVGYGAQKPDLWKPENK